MSEGRASDDIMRQHRRKLQQHKHIYVYIYTPGATISITMFGVRMFMVCCSRCSPKPWTHPCVLTTSTAPDPPLVRLDDDVRCKRIVFQSSNDVILRHSSSLADAVEVENGTLLRRGGPNKESCDVITLQACQQDRPARRKYD